MNTRRLVLFILFLSIFVMAMRISTDTDTWWHLASGQHILEQRSVPQVDIFSHTSAGQPWLGASVGWLMQIALFTIYNTLGYAGLNLFVALTVTATFAVLYSALSGGVFLRAFILVLAAVTAGVYWAARPYMLSFLLVAITLTMLEDFRWGRKERLWWLPVIMLVWANGHGGFAYGFILWGLYGLSEGLAWLGQTRPVNSLFPRITRQWLTNGLRGRVGHMLLIGLLMVLAVCFNPAGPKMLLYPFQTISIGALRDLIQEWQSPDFHQRAVQPFAWFIFALIAAIGASDKRLVLSDFLLISGFGYLGLLAGRNIALFALAAPIVLSRHLAPLAAQLGTRLGYHGLKNNQPPRWQAILNWGLLALLGLGVLAKTALVLPADINQAHVDSFEPVAAAEYIKDTQPSGALLNSYNWGGYLIWALPDYPVFIDGRTDLYGDQIIGEWLALVQTKGDWEEKLTERQINLVLLEPHWPIIAELAEAGWTQLYQDEISVIYARP